MGPKSVWEDAASYFTIKFWFKQCRWGKSIQEDPGCGKRVEARTTENIKKVEVLVLAD
jgi:hypothetical protein